MNPLVGMLVNQLGSQAMSQIGQQIGTDAPAAQNAVGAALPMLMSAFGQTASQPSGLNAITQALQENDGTILDDVVGFLGNQAAGRVGGNILNQVLGGQADSLIGQVSQATGIGSGGSSQLLGLLAPLLLGAIGKFTQQSGLDIGSIAPMLAGAAGGGGNDLLGMAAGMLDADGDGNVVDDIAGLVGKFMN
jgi:hypothetical protein